jgi:UPF0042 nucleotide-binding protein
MKKLDLILLTGISGAGRTSAIKILEDLDFEVIDNFPISLAESLVEYWRKKTSYGNSLAIGVDTRSHDFSYISLQNLIVFLESQKDIALKILFLECSNSTIYNRYNESRRRHPIKGLPLVEALEKERQLLSFIKNKSDDIIDTTDMSIRSLKNILFAKFYKDCEAEIIINITSFSYRYGVPKESDLVFDLRCLQNPFYESDIKELSGLEEKVRNYICQDKIWQSLSSSLKNYIETSIEGFVRQGRSYLNISFGCTGGKHRSVFVADYFAKCLQNSFKKVMISHRDLQIKT